MLTRILMAVVAVFTFAALLACSSDPPVAHNDNTEVDGEVIHPPGTPVRPWSTIVDPAATGTYQSRAVIPTKDNGCLMLGAVAIGDPMASDALVIKFDSRGAIEWRREYDGGWYDNIHAGCATADGNIAMVGITSPSRQNLRKLTVDGDVLWESDLGNLFLNSNNVLSETGDGGFVVVGRYPSVNARPRIVRTDKSGTVLWSHSLQLSAHGDIRAVLETSDGGFLCASVRNRFDSMEADMLLIKTDSEGNPVWQREFGRVGVDVPMALVQVNDTYVMAGWGKGTGGYDIILYAVDASGSLLWEYQDHSPTSSDCADMCLAENGDLLLVGRQMPNMCGGNGSILVSRIAWGGRLLWSKTYDQGQFGYYPAIAEAADGGILVTYDKGPRAHVMKLGPNGEL